jgi:hypothetical protein
VSVEESRQQADNDPAADLALKTAVDDAAINRAAADVVAAASELGEFMGTLSTALEDITLKETADKAALKKAINLFGRATGELSRASGVLSDLVALKKATDVKSDSADAVAPDQEAAVSASKKMADELRKSVTELAKATDALSQRVGERGLSGGTDEPAQKRPADDIALKSPTDD